MADGKWVPGLTAETPVAEAAAAVLAARLEVVRHYLPLAAEKPYEDAEYVHQLRVGTRRAGAALRVFRDCLPRKQHKATKLYLRALRRAAGDARDWDVFLLGLPGAKPLAAATGKPALDFLIGYGMGERSAAQARLASAAELSGPGFAEESAALSAAAHAPGGDDPPGNFGDLAAVQFGRLIRDFDDAVKANPTEPAALHQLRILGKRARYALEIFADAFPPAFKDSLYPAIERVQEILGEIQDAAVGLERLAALRDRVKQTVPRELPRLRKGIEGLARVLRAKVPAGQKAFQAWRKEWTALVEGLQLEIAAATVVA
ncbi:MAG TPA: CHAD domain-containing protein [Gemmata sp.]|nr:CHAD domain-containing protein [Gemmata sp.]